MCPAVYCDRILKRRIPVDSQAHDGRHDVPSKGHQPSSSEGHISWRAVSFVLLILLVGAVVGHGLLRDPAAAGRKLPCGRESACAGCPSSQTCQADPDGAVAKPDACTAGCDAAGCPASRPAVPWARRAALACRTARHLPAVPLRRPVMPLRTNGNVRATDLPL